MFNQLISEIEYLSLDNIHGEFGGFEGLMPFRVKRILLVATLYDSFLLGDDERLNEALFGDSFDASSSNTPIIIRVPNKDKAIERLKSGNYDLVIAMIQYSEADLEELIEGIKEQNTQIPIVLLSFNSRDILGISERILTSLNGTFLWHGDTRIFPAIINLIEDRINFPQDSSVGVQAVLLVEDNIKFYSSYLPIIYSELMKQTQIVMSDELNQKRKALRLKARPKILLATNFEEALSIYAQYRSNLLGIISDVEYPYQGKCDPNAGIKLATVVKSDNGDMPIMLQSFQSIYENKARELEISFVNKSAPDLTRKLRNFIVNYFGFGDFIFSDGGGRILGRASDIQSFLEMLKRVPVESVVYHAMRNHFSKWLLARTEFDIAYMLRPKKISEFNSSEELREYLVESIFRFIYKSQRGTVLKFDRRRFKESNPFVKIGSGSLGGKARGLAFVHFLLGMNAFDGRYERLLVKAPNTVVLATDIFDYFIEKNRLSNISDKLSTMKTAQLFMRAQFPKYISRALRTIVERIKDPIVVRSSSLLEDSKTQPFAGIYNTYMLANNDPDPEIRHRELEKAVKCVYASTYSQQAWEYRKRTPHIPDDEKMAVIIQKVVGRTYNNKYFYPLFSGVMQSYNYYPVSPFTHEDPIVHIAMGLGRTIVDGHTVLRFSPTWPQSLHQFSTMEDYFSNSQKKFMALDMFPAKKGLLSYEDEPDTVLLDTEVGQNDGTLRLLASSYSVENDLIRDNIHGDGIPIITFAPILKNQMIPLAPLLCDLSKLGKEAMGCNIEMEFAADYDPVTNYTHFNIIQIRPMVSKNSTQKVKMNDLKEKTIICHSNSALGNGIFDSINHLIFVKVDGFDTFKMKEMAEEIGHLNKNIVPENKNYILIGPGRWGSADPLLGIPVKWNQISKARIIVEAQYSGFVVDPSFGTHFFHNVTSLGMGYFTINSTHEGKIDFDLLFKQKVLYDSPQLRLIEFNRPLDIRVDGSENVGIIAMGEEK